ncbi:ATP-binding protein [Arsukibacterium sp.]|uniref:ATP-binding protein n=1 Tax=Arsukibacterium sp. TaxID=1977258 RepID=UPI002FD89909
MHRLFLHFYVFLFLILLGLGWTIEQLWRHVQPATEPALVTAMADQLTLLLAQPQWPSLVSVPYQTVPMQAINWQAQELELLQRGQLLSLFQDDRVYFYALMQDELWQLGPLPLDTSAGFDWFSLLFFVLLAIAVALWLWPVARDIRFLQQQLQRFGQGQDASLQLPARSFIAPIADSFQQMSQQIRALLELQREMTHAVSHELRTPIARLTFALEMARQLPETERDLMLQDVRELQQLVDEMLDYAKLETHQLSLKKQQVDLVELLHNLREKLSVLPGAPITLLLPEKAVLHGDGHYLERAIQNLLVNAKRFAHSQVQVKLSRQAGSWTLSVEDDGPGIPKEQRAEVIKPFLRLEQSRSKAGGGFGLGLAIVLRITQWHHGRLLIDDSSLGGARMRLVIPE